VGANPVSFSDPQGLYSCTYSINVHTLSCTSLDPAHPSFLSDQFVSGNNQSQNCPDCQNNPDRTGGANAFLGPLPETNYLIGPQHGLSRRDLIPIDPTQMQGRSNMQLHGCSNPASCSNGCIAAIPNAVRDNLNRLLRLEDGTNWLRVVP
jgi:hypothetical protein